MNILCACGSNKKYADCCEPFLQGKDFPSTPEALMRSRYTAYVQADIDYVERTMRGRALQGFQVEPTRQWTLQTEWLGLTVINAEELAPTATVGFVEFIAAFSEKGQRQIIHERSEFHKIDHHWYYVDGRTPKINRNDPCPCGSGKKFKQCCQA